jgi:hypothetical protein
MKKFQQLCAATLLTLMLALSTFAGEIPAPSVIAPPPPPAITSTGDIQLRGSSAEGQIETSLASDADSVAEVALILLVGALSVF